MRKEEGLAPLVAGGDSAIEEHQASKRIATPIEITFGQESRDKRHCVSSLVDERKTFIYSFYITFIQ